MEGPSASKRFIWIALGCEPAAGGNARDDAAYGLISGDGSQFVDTGAAGHAGAGSCQCDGGQGRWNADHLAGAHRRQIKL